MRAPIRRPALVEVNRFFLEAARSRASCRVYAVGQRLELRDVPHHAPFETLVVHVRSSVALASNPFYP